MQLSFYNRYYYCHYNYYNHYYYCHYNYYNHYYYCHYNDSLCSVVLGFIERVSSTEFSICITNYLVTSLQYSYINNTSSGMLSMLDNLSVKCFQ